MQRDWIEWQQLKASPAPSMLAQGDRKPEGARAPQVCLPRVAIDWEMYLEPCLWGLRWSRSRRGQ
ncbi:hypothetical protein C8Q74DRAFT_1292835 [Fomes fomentarius]|nr:hypothetical protein C8Q74DRAFT_1292835 [Fomes fomentarius]